MLPVEAVVRGYVVGGGWKEYQKKGSISGVALPKDLPNCAKLKSPIFTPSTKAEIGIHDENITHEEASKIIGKDVFEVNKTFF